MPAKEKEIKQSKAFFAERCLNNIFTAFLRFVKKGAIPVFLSVFLVIPQAVSSQPAKTVRYTVRVAVVADAPKIVITIKGSYNICGLPLLKLLKEGTDLDNVVIKPDYSGLVMGGEKLNIYGIKIKPAESSEICIDKRKFRGDVDIIRTEDLKLLVVNHLDIEDYISGVLYHEVSHWWPIETLKAQAIASRTFAIYKSLEAKSKDYDLTSDVYSQVYGGKTSERLRTTLAVMETAGKILAYDNNVLPAYFHATCGGHTEDASLLWKTDISPLKGRPCKYCEWSPHYRWSKEVPLKSVEELLNKADYKIKDIKGIEASSTDISGRVKEVHVIDSLGTEKIPSNKFRLALGPDLIRSTNFSVTIEGDKAVFNGKGWGHGVGMCQWGAYSMARRGLTAEDILKFYYPGAKIVNLKDYFKKK